MTEERYWIIAGGRAWGVSSAEPSAVQRVADVQGLTNFELVKTVSIYKASSQTIKTWDHTPYETSGAA